MISCDFGPELHGMQEVGGSIPPGSTIHPFTGIQPTLTPSMSHTEPIVF
jgi:hypothetical protein